MHLYEPYGLLTIHAEDTSRTTKLSRRPTNPILSPNRPTAATSRHRDHHHHPLCRTLRHPWPHLRRRLRVPRHPSFPPHIQHLYPCPRFSRCPWVNTTLRITRHPPTLLPRRPLRFRQHICLYLHPFQIVRRSHDQDMRDTVQMSSVSFRNTRCFRRRMRKY